MHRGLKEILRQSTKDGQGSLKEYVKGSTKKQGTKQFRRDLLNRPRGV